MFRGLAYLGGPVQARRSLGAGLNSPDFQFQVAPPLEPEKSGTARILPPPRSRLYKPSRSQALISEWVFRHCRTRPGRSRGICSGTGGSGGQAAAKLPAEPGRGGHSLRREFATEMKYDFGRTDRWGQT
jgi:hypothetical protein